jgi:hypothetical protein
MTTVASSITGDYSEVFFKQAPSQKRILLIDDQSDTAMLVTLNQEGYEVTAVESPQRTWSLVWTLRPHFIIIHLTNPSRRDIASLQGCSVLAGGVPVIVAAPVSGRLDPCQGSRKSCPGLSLFSNRTVRTTENFD